MISHSLLINTLSNFFQCGIHLVVRPSKASTCYMYFPKLIQTQDCIEHIRKSISLKPLILFRSMSKDVKVTSNHIGDSSPSIKRS
jgi:hypothetical protein